MLLLCQLTLQFSSIFLPVLKIWLLQSIINSIHIRSFELSSPPLHTNFMFTIQLWSLTVTLIVLLFWVSFFLLILVFLLKWLSLHLENLIMLLPQFPFTFHQTQKGDAYFLASSWLLLCKIVLKEFERCSMGGYL